MKLARSPARDELRAGYLVCSALINNMRMGKSTREEKEQDSKWILTLMLTIHTQLHH
jgi:hypothetical protein